jgi:hypothetical protein
MNNKLCPMYTKKIGYESGFHCIEDRCAWWDNFNSACAVVGIARNLEDVNNAIIDISINEAIENINKRGN